MGGGGEPISLLPAKNLPFHPPTAGWTIPRVASRSGSAGAKRQPQIVPDLVGRIDLGASIRLRHRTPPGRHRRRRRCHLGASWCPHRRRDLIGGPEHPQQGGSTAVSLILRGGGKRRRGAGGVQPVGASRRGAGGPLPRRAHRHSRSANS